LESLLQVKLPVVYAHTYTNPVYPKYFADPFVWRHDGTYYAIGTGPAEATGHADREPRAIPLLRSIDFANWEFVHLALCRPSNSLGDAIWAPEIAYDNGRFFMYYSVGHGDKNHQLRVAASDTPEGPYRDVAGPLQDLRSCPFAIDPQPFRDDDGQWYLFYARDFLDNDDGVRAGTALVVDRLIDMTRLAGQETVVLRARYDWQRFKANRPMYGRVFDWHTLEGPSVRKRGGRYYCFYSGGCWDSENYGVDYGVADNVMGPYDNGGGQHGPRVLRTIPGQILGPGHNSIVTGPDGRTDYIVYHAWDPNRQARRMHIDPLVWGPGGPRCDGPTLTAQTIATN
jgi:beta-xylosidase